MNSDKFFKKKENKLKTAPSMLLGHDGDGTSDYKTSSNCVVKMACHELASVRPT